MKWTSEKILELIEEGKLYKFYKSKEWKQVKGEVLRDAKYKCEWCRERGRLVAAEEVHHIQFLKKHPSLALEKEFTYQGNRYKNLVALCHDCHDKAHGRMKYKKKVELTEEKW